MSKPPAEELADAALGDRYALSLSTGKEVRGVVEEMEVRSYPGEPAERRLVFVDERGEYSYDISMMLDRGDAPSVSRTVFADTAAKLGRIEWDDVDDPDEAVTLDEGTVTGVEVVEDA